MKINSFMSKTVLVGVAAALAVSSASVVSALSIAPEEEWSPESFTAHANLHYAGNSLILDATSSTATFFSTEYPFNKSMSDLRLSSAESNSVLQGQLVWGVALPNSQTPEDNYKLGILTGPDGIPHRITADGEYSVQGEQYTSYYYIADVSSMNYETGIYSVSVPGLSETLFTPVAAGWALTIAAQDNTAPLRSFEYLWGQELSMGAYTEGLGFGLFPSDDPATLIELSANQSREPAFGFTGLSDIVLGQDDNAGMLLSSSVDKQLSNQLAYAVTVRAIDAPSLDGTIQFFDSSTREPLENVQEGQKLTVQVAVMNSSKVNLYDSEITILLPPYLEYKRGSMNTLAGSINSGTLTDRDDDDPARFMQRESTIIWKPGDTSVSNTRTPYLLKPEDSAQYLEFEAYVGNYPINHSVRIQGTTAAKSTGRTSDAISGLFTVMNAPTLPGESSSPKTELRVEAVLSPQSSTYWAMNVIVRNESAFASKYEWTLVLPESAQYLDLEKSALSCELEDPTSRSLTCRSITTVPAHGTNVDKLMVRLNKLPDAADWVNVKVSPLPSSSADIDTLNNSTPITIQYHAFAVEPEANSDVFTSEVNASYQSFESVLANDTYIRGNIDIEIIEQPAHGRVKVEPNGMFQYEQITRALIDADTFSYALRDKITGTLSKPATVTITFPAKLEKG